MNLRRFIRKSIAASYIIRTKAFPSFSQSGEDRIVGYLFHALQMTKPTYLDIGANHPLSGSNTYFFYHYGSRGVCIEPDPEMFSLIKKMRPKDVALNIGIGLYEEEKAKLYIFPYPYSGWNTFSYEEAKQREIESAIKIAKVHEVQLRPINEIIEKYFNPHPNFLSIDVEGMDLQILQSIDFERFKPEVICTETITFSTKNQEEKVFDSIRFLESKGYFVFADTHIN